MVEECLPAELLDVVNRPDPAADARACDVPTFSLFDVIFRHVEEYDGLPDLLTLYAFILEAEQSAAAYARDYGGAVREFTKAQWVKASRGCSTIPQPPKSSSHAFGCRPSMQDVCQCCDGVLKPGDWMNRVP